MFDRFLSKPLSRGYLNTAWKASTFGVFLVRIFPHLDWIWRDMEYLSWFSPKAGKYRPEKVWIQTLFTQWQSSKINHFKILRSQGYIWILTFKKMTLIIQLRILKLFNVSNLPSWWFSLHKISIEVNRS